ncbi:MAG: hypothetical protein JSR62_06455 [Nitrospira sp.]|nr:hypothetical protein [Nitrospira sp.]
MKNTLLAVLAFIPALLWPGVLRAEGMWVSLSDETAPSWTIAAANAPTIKATLTFYIQDFPFHPAVKTCTLRVVAKPHQGDSRASQDVQVRWTSPQGKEEQVGQWSATDKETNKETKPYVAELDPKACVPNKRVKFLLQTESPHTSWEYYGGDRDPAAERPRLIVTYDLPTPPHSRDSTDWTYEQPVGHFASPLWKGQRLTNPVSYDGAVYVVAPCPSADKGSCLHRIGGVGSIRSWPLDASDSSVVTTGSFAFVTAWGGMKIISKDAIHSCDLRQETCSSAGRQQITVNAEETPAMGQDGSLYFKNVEAHGSIVAKDYSRCAARSEFWRTTLKFTAVSPITLSANGRNAYALADIPIQETNATRKIALIRMDTATGETVVHEIFHCGAETAPCDESKKVKPDLKTLLKPAVASKVIKVGGRETTVDYVFVAGNTSDTSIVQAIMYEPCVPSIQNCPAPTMLWSQDATVSLAPVLSPDGNALFVVQGHDGRVNRYDWYKSTRDRTGAVANPVAKQVMHLHKLMPVVVDGGNWPYTCPRNGFRCEFTADGTLLGYSDEAIYDLTPMASKDRELQPSSLRTGTIYSANKVVAPPTPGVQAGDRVILKGQGIGLPKEFRWPIGATVQMQSVGPETP